MLTDAERRELTLRLLGTGKRGEPPGPLDAGWVVQHLAGTRTTLQRWREVGIPPSRLDEVLGAVRGLVPETQKSAPPAEADEAFRKFVERWDSDNPPPWAEALTQRIVDEVKRLRDQSRDEAVRAVFDYVDDEERGKPPHDASVPDTEDPPASRPAQPPRHP